MCNLIRMDLGADWIEDIMNHSRKITKYQSLSNEGAIITTFEYPDKDTVIRIHENRISKKKTREIVKYDDDGNPISSILFLFANNEWQKFVESQYSYNSEKNIKYCCRTRFLENENIIIEKSETHSLKTEKFLKIIYTNQETNHQSIEEFKYDNCGREVEFLMYDIRNDELLNVLKTTNEFDNNIVVYSVFSTIDIESNEWSITSKTTTETLPQKLIQITEFFEDGILTSKEKQIKYLNSSKQIDEILVSEWSDNSWRLISKIRYVYSNQYLKRESLFSFKKNTWAPVEKTEYENLDGFITKKICFEKCDRIWVKTSEQLYEYI
ncbi:MAG: hypothetical protein K9N07_11570 [Candidatus Cloacimonetes bacterium]|nr:hypothetical protein [Candidatus Cloacimonadota bacterium]